MHLNNLSDEQLILETKKAIVAEVRAATNVVRYFCEVYTRDLYLARGCSSMFLFATKMLGCDRASAQRRVNAMELALVVPGVLAKIDQRKLFLQSVADIQSFLNLQRGKKMAYSVEQIKALVEKCTGKTTREVQIELSMRDPVIDFKYSKKFIAADRVRVSYASAVSTEEKLDKIKNLLSHSNPYLTREELIDYMAEVTLDNIDPARKAARADERLSRKLKKESGDQSAPVVPAQELTESEQLISGFGKLSTNEDLSMVMNTDLAAEFASSGIPVVEEIVSAAGEVQLAVTFDSETLCASSSANARRYRYITAADDRAVRATNDDRGCEFIDAETGAACGSTHQLQRDHVHVYSRGGSNGADNLQMLCAKHNRYRWRSRKQGFSAAATNQNSSDGYSTLRSPVLAYAG